MDFKASLIEFSNKDIHKPLYKPKPEIYIRKSYNDYLNNNSDIKSRWALNTEKSCCFEEKLPKIQQFKNYNFINRKSLRLRDNEGSLSPLKSPFSILQTESNSTNKIKSNYFEMKSKIFVY